MGCLSLPPGQSVYETTPVLSSIHPSLAHIYPTVDSLAQTGEADDTEKSSAGSYLTLVLVCRSKAKGDRTRELLLNEHEVLLKQRAKKGVLAVEGWWEELDIQIQTCDQSTLGGDNGVLALCERLHETYAQDTCNRVVPVLMIPVSRTSPFSTSTQPTRNSLGTTISHLPNNYSRKGPSKPSPDPSS